MMRKLKAAGATDTGRVRQRNEDRLLIQPPLALVADGMGGHLLGDAAAQVIVDVFARPAWNTFSSDTSRTTELAKCAEKSHQKISKIAHLAQTGEESVVVGATIAGALLCGENAHWLVFHAGDARVYLWRRSALTQVSIDHSYVQSLVDKGVITPTQARTHPGRNIVTRSIGSRGNGQLEFQTFGAHAGDTIVICSDGLTGEVSDAQIASLMREMAEESLQSQAFALRDTALTNGGRDNVSVILMKIGEES